MSYEWHYFDQHVLSLPSQMQDKTPNAGLSFEGGKNLVLILPCIQWNKNNWLAHTELPWGPSRRRNRAATFLGITWRVMVRQPQGFLSSRAWALLISQSSFPQKSISVGCLSSPIKELEVFCMGMFWDAHGAHLEKEGMQTGASVLSQWPERSQLRPDRQVWNLFLFFKLEYNCFTVLC